MKLIITLLTLHTLNLFSQVSQEWVARYNGTGNNSDEASALTVDGAGNVYVTGHSIGNGTFDDFATVKYNSSGAILWVSRYNGQGSSSDAPYSIAVDAAGNVYITGNILSGLYSDYATVKYNSNGVQQWVSKYNGPGNQDDVARSIAVDGSGNVYVTGSSFGSGSGYDYATIKYNSSGLQQWVVRYNGSANGYDWAYKLSVDGSGNVYVTGQSYDNTRGYDFVTVKYNSSGIQQWTARYGGFDNDWPNSMVVDLNGSVYVTGQTISSSTANDYVTIKYNTSGVQQWAVKYNGTGSGVDIANSIAVDNLGFVYVTGISYAGGTVYDFATIKYNASGDTVWVRKYNGQNNSTDEGCAIAVDGMGSVYVTGYCAMYGTTSQIDYATIKYNAAGEPLWVKSYNGPGNDEDRANSIVLDNSGNVYIAGKSRGNGTGQDFATIKYSQTIGINPISAEIPESFSLYQNYPNPFNPSTKIVFSIPSVETTRWVVSLKVYDMLGREVTTLVNQHLSPGTYEVNWDATNQPSGLYFYKLTSSDFTETKKMILIK